MCHSPLLQELGLTIIRVGFGVIFTIFGYQKLISGAANLTQLGSAIGLFGITWGHLLWGYAAALTLLFGGLAFTLGLYVRIASLPLLWFLIVALYFHFQNNDPFVKWAFAAMSLCIVAAFFVAGGGTYSIDCAIKKCVTNSADQSAANR
jgi:putative oxidoreductase